MTPGFALPSNLAALRPCSRPRASDRREKIETPLSCHALPMVGQRFAQLTSAFPDYKCIGAELGAPREHARPSARHNEYPVKLGRVAPSRCKRPAGAFRLSACPSATRSGNGIPGVSVRPAPPPKQCDHRRTGSHRYARQWARPWTMRRQVRMAWTATHRQF